MKELKYSNTGKIRELTVEEDYISIGVDYDDLGSQNGSFPFSDKNKLKTLFPVGEKVRVLFDSPDPWRGRQIKGLINSHNEDYIIDPVWHEGLNDKRQKEYEEYQKKYKEKMMAIPRYRYESKYQFPDDIDIYGNIEEHGEGFRNSLHLSVSRGMEFMEDKDPKDFSMKEYQNIKGVTEDNKNVEELKHHIDECVMKELGDNWGHSGMSMILATGHVLKAKELGWDKYIEWIRSWPSNNKNKKGDNKK